MMYNRDDRGGALWRRPQEGMSRQRGSDWLWQRDPWQEMQEMQLKLKLVNQCELYQFYLFWLELEWMLDLEKKKLLKVKSMNRYYLNTNTCFGGSWRRSS